MIAPHSVNEVGCIHTSQGLEGDFFGVIIGPDVALREGRLVGVPENRASTDQSLRGYKQALLVDEAFAREHADKLIRNTYRTLLTRGAMGTFIYCTDPEVAEFLREKLREAHVRQ
jgi:hypothetical protein